MKKVYNGNNKLVAMINESTGTVIIVQRGYTTLLHLKPDGTIEVTNTEETEAS